MPTFKIEVWRKKWDFDNKDPAHTTVAHSESQVQDTLRRVYKVGQLNPPYRVILISQPNGVKVFYECHGQSDWQRLVSNPSHTQYILQYRLPGSSWEKAAVYPSRVAARKGTRNMLRMYPNLREAEWQIVEYTPNF